MDLIISATSSLLASFLVYPMDVIKSQLQILSTNRSHGDSIKNVKPSINQVFKGIYTSGTMYKGVGSFLTTYPIFWTVYFQATRNKIELTNSKYCNDIITTLFGSTLGSVVANPFFIVKTRLQNELIMQKMVPSSGFTILKDILKKQGVKGLTKGLGVSIANNGKLIIQMPLYNIIKDKTDNVFLSSLAAKTTCSLITYPCDLIRTLQRNSDKKISITNIYKQYGILGYYKGITPYFLMSLPNFVLMMTIQEWLQEWLQE